MFPGESNASTPAAAMNGSAGARLAVARLLSRSFGFESSAARTECRLTLRHDPFDRNQSGRPSASVRLIGIAAAISSSLGPDDDALMNARDETIASNLSIALRRALFDSSADRDRDSMGRPATEIRASGLASRNLAMA